MQTRPHAIAEEAAHRLDRVLGDQAVVTHGDRAAIVEPLTEEACARALGACSNQGWRTSVSGRSEWSRERVSCPVRISLRRLDRVVSVRPADLYATVSAGCLLEDFANELTAQGMGMPVDAPGPMRTVGSVLATGTQGALRTGFGGVRDQVLGLTVLTGNGRVLRLGGRVVKNVAGFDLAKLTIGGFGAYGVITSANLKVRAAPNQDITIQAAGDRNRLLALAARILRAGLAPAALELAAEGADWKLSARVMGSAAHAAARVSALNDVGEGAFDELSPTAGEQWWSEQRAAAVSGPTTVRMGATLGTAQAALDLTDPHPGTRSMTFGYGGVTLRWSGALDARDVLRIRGTAARSNMPVVIERGPSSLMTKVGHFGALPDGTLRLARSLQRVFDPSGILCAPVWGS